MSHHTSKIRGWTRSVLLASLTLLSACSGTDPSADGKTVIKYWDKWNGPEADAMRAVVDDFNASQDKIYVDFSAVSSMDRRLMLSIAGGVPPDVAGVYGKSLPVYAENNALMPLDKMAAGAGIKREQYIDVFWSICFYRGHLWGLPTTPDCLALVWNKKLFREAGLDPEKPPTSLAELELFNEKLVKRRADGRLASCGFLPSEPGWWNETWGLWFGGKLWDGDKTITANSPENIAAFDWIASYPKRFGAEDLLAFREGFGNFASPQNPFFTGRVAMVLQGPWISNFIKHLAPADFEWGVAPFPSADPARWKNVTLAETDALIIPAGAKHPQEAFTFITYVNSQKPMEKLCLAQCKFSPLRACSPDFFKNHPNPHISTFLEIANSPNAQIIPQLTSWTLYSNDLQQAFNNVWSGQAMPKESLDEVERHEQQTFDQHQKRWDRLSAILTKEWNQP